MQAQLEKINEEDKVQAKSFISNISNETKKRGYVNYIAIKAFERFLDKNELSSTIDNSYFSNKFLLESYDVADLLVDNIRIDLRVIVGDDYPQMCVPKEHKYSYFKPDLYVGIKVDKNLEEVNIVGFASYDEIEHSPYTDKYFVIESDKLRDISEFKDVLKDITPKDNFLLEADHTKAKELFVSYIDCEISSIEKEFLVRHLASCTECRAEFFDLFNMDQKYKNLDKGMFDTAIVESGISIIQKVKDTILKSEPEIIGLSQIQEQCSDEIDDTQDLSEDEPVKEPVSEAEEDYLEDEKDYTLDLFFGAEKLQDKNAEVKGDKTLDEDQEDDYYEEIEYEEQIKNYKPKKYQPEQYDYLGEDTPQNNIETPSSESNDILVDYARSTNQLNRINSLNDDLTSNNLILEKIRNNKTAIITATSVVLLIGFSQMKMNDNHNTKIDNFVVNQIQQVKPVEEVKEQVAMVAPIPDLPVVESLTEPIVEGNSNIDEVFARAFTAEGVSVKIRDISWKVSPELARNSDFRTFLVVTGQAFKNSLSDNLLKASDKALNDKIRVDIIFSKDGVVDSLNLSENSGSSQIDSLVLQTVKETLKYTKMPKISTQEEFVKAGIVISL